MKKTAFVSAALAFMVLIFGLLFMLYHIPYSNYVLSLGLLILAVSLIIFYTLDKRYMYVAGAFFCILPTTGLLFIQLNFHGGNALVTLGLLAFGLLFVPWYALKSFKDS